MSIPYFIYYSLRYSLKNIQAQIEVAVQIAATNIIAEDPLTVDHVNRLRWANWANMNSSAAWINFAWPVAQNSTIQANVQNDPTGNAVNDSDIQFVVNSNVESVVTYCIAHPPPGF